MKTLKTIIFSIALIAIFIPTQAQNLVPNPSFEEYSECPISDCQIYLTGWTININTADYFHSCSESDFSIPDNCFGYQYTFDTNCLGYCGLYSYTFQVENHREYFGTELDSPLIIGQRYYVSLKISLADDYKYAINNIGILFTNTYFEEISGSNPFLEIWPAPLLNNFAHVYSDEVITDKENWTTIKGSFVADSAYQQIIISNFFSDENTDVIQLEDGEFNAAYYYIDDVCVSTDSVYCCNYNYTCDTNLLIDIINNHRIEIYPNPAKNYFHIEIDELTYIEKPEIEIYSALGKLVYKNQLNEILTQVNAENLKSGLYFVKIYSKNEITVKKLVIK